MSPRSRNVSDPQARRDPPAVPHGALRGRSRLACALTSGSDSLAPGRPTPGTASLAPRDPTATPTPRTASLAPRVPTEPSAPHAPRASGPGWITVLFAGLAAAILSGCDKPPAPVAANSAPRGPRAYRVTTTVVAARPLAYEVAAVGSLEAYDVVPVSARVEGTLSALAFDEGAEVSPETVLAEIDRGRFALDVRAAEADIARQEAAVARAQLQVIAAEPAIARMRAQTARAQAALAEAKANLARRAELHQRDATAVSREEIATFEAAVAKVEAELDMSRGSEVESAADLEVARGQVSEARAALEQARVRAEIARRDLDDSRVRSPIAGVVQTRHVAAGQFVRVGEKIATLVDIRRLRLRFRVGEAESVRLRPGQPVRFKVKPFPDRAFAAELIHVHATADPQTRMIECLASVADPDPALKPGFFATVRMEISRSDQAIVIPEESILPTERGFVAFVVEAGKARQRDLTPGLHTADGGVEILLGLAAGETLVLRGAQMLQNGVPVEVATDGGSAPPPSEK